MQRQVFVTGGTGYIGRLLIERLAARGHSVRALVRAGSEGRLPAGAAPVVGDALSAASYAARVAPADTLVQLVGTPHPSPRKAAEFERVDRPSGLAAVEAALTAGVKHLVYVSVAHPAPIMHEYIAARVAVEARIREAHASANLNATILRPWYVLGPGHRWAHVLSPLYALGRLVPSMRAGAERLGLVTREEMLAALVQAVERPADGVRVLDVPAIRRARGTLRTVVSVFCLIPTLAVGAHAQAIIGPDTVIVRSGSLTLRALLWRPSGRGPHPAVLFSHGSGPNMEPEKPAAPGRSSRAMDMSFSSSTGAGRDSPLPRASCPRY